MTETPTRDHQELARRTRARRLELNLPITALAQQAGLSKDTYRRVEEGRSVRDLTYAQIDGALGWAPGSCVAILNGGDPAPSRGGTSASPSPAAISEEDISQTILIATVKNSDLSAAEIRAIRDDVIAELKQRGLL